MFTVEKKKWDSNKITPGTKFMKELSDKLNEFKKILEEDDITKMFISDASEIGEGEHKMMKEIDKISNIDNSTKNIFIYGLDADLIMLSLLKQQAKNKEYDNISIVLLRDNSFGKNTKELFSSSETFFTYIKIKSLENGICKEVKYMHKNITLTNREIITDYIFICFLLGNDFLEHIPSLMIKKNGLHFLLTCYIKTITKYNCSIINLKHLDDIMNWKKSINLHILSNLFNEIQNNEEYFLKHILSTNEIIFKDNNLLLNLQETKNENEKENENDQIQDIILKEKDKTEDLVVSVKNKNTNIIFNLKNVIKYNEKNYKNRYYSYYNNIQ